MGRRICIIGDGGWGTAIALLLLENGHRPAVWGPFPDYVETLRRTRENTNFLPGVALPAGINFTADREEAVAGAEIVVLAMPTKFFRPVLESFANLIPGNSIVMSVAKGFDPQTHKRMTEVANEILGRKDAAALSGPSLAPEVARGIPTAVVIASGDQASGLKLQDAFNSARFRVYTSDDVAGVELGGALKNIMAIAAGMSDGIGFGDNSRAALITRGLAEITRLGTALGAKASTFAGLSGMGDLIVTCTSKLSRNHSVGERLGKGEKLDDILAGMKQVAEGVWNCAIARDLARAAKVEVPITDEVYAIIHKGKKPRDALASLMGRTVKPEAG